MDHFVDLTYSEKILRRKADLLHMPIAGTFELTPLCNMDCRMCYVRMSKKEMEETGRRVHTADEWIDLGRQAVEQGMMFLLLTGGEPFLYPDFVKVYHALRNMGLVIMINSNGTLLTDEILEELKTNKPRRVNLSLYGSSDKIYEDLCRNPRGFTQLMECVDKLQANNIDVRFNMALTPWNKDDFPNMIKFALERNIPTSIANYIFPASRRNLTCEEAALHRFSPELAGKYNMELSALYNTEEELLATARKRLKIAEIGMDKPEVQPHGFWCRGGTSAFWMSWDHRILPCGMVQKPEVFMDDKTFEEGWKELREKLEAIMLSSECYHCKKRGVCQTCAASMLGETGSFDKVPEYQCRLTDATLAACDRIIEEYRHD